MRITKSPLQIFIVNLVAIVTICITAVWSWASPADLPEFSGIDLVTMKSIKSNGNSKRPLVLVFLSSKCPCSMSHIPELKALATEFKEFEFIGINSNSDESLENAHAYFDSIGLGFPVLRDQNFKFADHFKAAKTPHAFLIQTNGRIVFQGGVSNSSKFPQADRKFLREALEDIKTGSPIRTPHARALGCSIVR